MACAGDAAHEQALDRSRWAASKQHGSGDLVLHGVRCPSEHASHCGVDFSRLPPGLCKASQRAGGEIL